MRSTVQYDDHFSHIVEWIYIILTTLSSSPRYRHLKTSFTKFLLIALIDSRFGENVTSSKVGFRSESSITSIP